MDLDSVSIYIKPFAFMSHVLDMFGSTVTATMICVFISPISNPIYFKSIKPRPSYPGSDSWKFITRLKIQPT